METLPHQNMLDFVDGCHITYKGKENKNEMLGTLFSFERNNIQCFVDENNFIFSICTM